MTLTLLERATPTRPSVPDPQAWWRVAAAMFVIGWGGNQFTPLLVAYRDLGGFSHLDVDVFLGAYVLGLIPGLLVAAAVSEARGRRPVLLFGLWSSLTGTLLLSFGVSAGYPGIVGGRMLSGIAVGVAMSVGSSWVTELSGGGRRCGSRPGWRSARPRPACSRRSPRR
jgi:MFS family permease